LPIPNQSTDGIKQFPAPSNLRRVGSAYCDETHDGDPPKQQQDAAGNCDAAKDELAQADTDDEVDIAVTKVRVLCDL